MQGVSAAVLDRAKTLKPEESAGKWIRQASIEAMGFGFGGAAGLATGKAVVLGLTAIGLGLTPVGWVVMIGVGIAAGATVGVYGDRVGKQFAKDIWEQG